MTFQEWVKSPIKEGARGKVFVEKGGVWAYTKLHTPAPSKSSGKTRVTGSHGEKVVINGEIATVRVNITLPL